MFLLVSQVFCVPIPTRYFCKCFELVLVDFINNFSTFHNRILFILKVNFLTFAACNFVKNSLMSIYVWNIALHFYDVCMNSPSKLTVKVQIITSLRCNNIFVTSYECYLQNFLKLINAKSNCETNFCPSNFKHRVKRFVNIILFGMTYTITMFSDKKKQNLTFEKASVINS